MTHNHLTEWVVLRNEIERMMSEGEPVINIAGPVLEQEKFEAALAMLLASQLASHRAGVDEYFLIFRNAYEEAAGLVCSAALDLTAIRDRDPAIDSLGVAFLFSKGFHALEIHRMAHHQWHTGRQSVALALSHATSCMMGVDIHPAAKIGASIMLDHASGIVVGETAEIGDNVTILHGVTLGGSGRVRCDRHPKVASEVFIGAHAAIIGNIRIGRNSVIGAGAVVLSDVPENSVAVGVPAKVRARKPAQSSEVETAQAIGGLTGSPVLLA